MTVSPVTEGGDALARVRRENETLYAVIKTVSSSLALDRVLGGIVEIATDATGCHACFIYFLEDERLVLRAASPRYAELVGKLEWGLDEGLTGWVARTKTPEFIRERALEDPRMKFVPELDEERFQSMVAVPILARDGDVIGVVVLHTEAPREFDDDVLNFLVHTGSLVGGAIENAQLYEDARRRVRRAHDAHPAEPVAGGGDAARGPLRRRDARGAPAAGRGRVPDLAARQRRRRADARRGRTRPNDSASRARPGRVAARPDAARAAEGAARPGGRARRTAACCWRRWWPATSGSASSAAWCAARGFGPRTPSSCSPLPTRPPSDSRRRS